jgi:hypothetical protein
MIPVVGLQAFGAPVSSLQTGASRTDHDCALMPTGFARRPASVRRNGSARSELVHSPRPYRRQFGGEIPRRNALLRGHLFQRVRSECTRHPPGPTVRRVRRPAPCASRIHRLGRFALGQRAMTGVSPSPLADRHRSCLRSVPGGSFDRPLCDGTSVFDSCSMPHIRRSPAGYNVQLPSR